MQDAIAVILEFMTQHSGWVVPIVFLLAVGETLAVVSLLVPSTAILLALGGLIAAGVFEFGPLFVAAALGSVVGSTVSFWFGRRYGASALERGAFALDAGLIERGRSAFARWGAGAVAIGHFFGPLRAVVFVLAGMSRMRPRLFHAVNLPACVLWGFAMPKSGELGGEALGSIWRALAGG